MRYLLIICLLLMSPPLGAQVAIMKAPNGANAEFGTNGNCGPILAMVSANLTVKENQTLILCPGIKKIAISQLVMEQGASIELPFDVFSFEMEIDHGAFAGRNIIFSNAGVSSGRTGANIKLRVNKTVLQFPIVTQSITQILSDIEASPDGSGKVAAMRAYGQGDALPVGQGILVRSRGGNGVNGGPGAKGANARRKRCSGSVGAPALQGLPGEAGQAGANGGNLTADFRLVSGHRTVTTLDFQMVSEGGNGGLGGHGGPGGDGAPGKSCVGFKRGGYGPGPQGPHGAKGADGVPGYIDLDFGY